MMAVDVMVEDLGNRLPQTTGDGLVVMGEGEGNVSNDPQVIVSRIVN